MRRNYRKTETVKIGETFEFLGKSEQLCVEGAVTVVLYPEEKATFEPPYPGAPPDCELLGFHADSITGYAPADGGIYYDFERADRPDWFAMLDTAIENWLYGKWRKVSDDYLERAAEAFLEP